MFYIKWGFEHIISLDGTDHILFIIALSLPFTFKHWRKVLLLVTAFTVGHAITLALSVFGILIYHTDFVELLIPFTIFITAVSNAINAKSGDKKRNYLLQYMYALGFGLIHGLAYSGQIKFSLSQMMDSILIPLFAFNIGLEAGQIIIVVLTLFLVFLLSYIPKVPLYAWRVLVSVLIALFAIKMIIQASFWTQL